MAHVDPSNRRERKKAETRARIVKAATDLFNLQGYQATSIEEITEAAHIAPRTFYSYFDAKVDVAMVQFDFWIDQFIAAFSARPESESPDQMYPRALADLGEQGFVTGQRLRDQSGRPFPPMGVGVLMAETEPEVAGRIYQTLLRLHISMANLFRQRLHYPQGAIEPHVLAGAVMACWFVAVHGFGDVAAVDPDPPSTDELGMAGFRLYTSGITQLWEGRVARQ
jgi:AcrR family transcriptional regulator